MATRPSLRVGIFVPFPVQLLDLACVDLLDVCSHGYLAGMSAMLPASLISLAPDVSFFYIGKDTPGTQLHLTAGLTLVTTHRFDDPAVAPGSLDVVLVPGPDPFAPEDSGEAAQGAIDWLRRQAAEERTDVLSVCTGIFLCGRAGLLDGKKVSGPRGLQDMLRERFPAAQLVGDDHRWVRDGRLWSSGGITNGNDLMAAYVRHRTDVIPGPVAEFACMSVDVGDRGQFYRDGKVAFTAGVVWQLFRGWLMTLTGKGKGVAKQE